MARGIAVFLWSKLPAGPTQFDKSVIGRSWTYAIGMFWITVLSVTLTQVDKIIFSKILSLVEFGYYMIAWTLASLLIKPASPV
ncbi:MAG: oligosaccharide flippase family protein, partial [Flammeovirgaceae bacterium]